MPLFIRICPKILITKIFITQTQIDILTKKIGPQISLAKIFITQIQINILAKEINSIIKTVRCVCFFYLFETKTNKNNKIK